MLLYGADVTQLTRTNLVVILSQIFAAPVCNDSSFLSFSHKLNLKTFFIFFESMVVLKYQIYDQKPKLKIVFKVVKSTPDSLMLFVYFS